jgi:hypothetical protein
MGASGSAWIKHKKRRGLRSDAMTNLPHPRDVRAGQRYFPLASRAKNVVTLKVLRTTGDTCELKREDDVGKLVRVRSSNLLATGPDGTGRLYRFIGFAERSGYPTQAFVLDVDAPWAQLVLPEWHPETPVTIAAGSLASALRTPGVWVSCRANLGADAGARVQPTRFSPVPADFDPSIHHPVPRPATHSGLNRRDESSVDVVLFVGGAELEDARSGPGVYLTGHPPITRPGARAYVHADGGVQGWRTIRSLRPLPNGVRVNLAGAWHPVILDKQPSLPLSAVADGRHGHQMWVPRSWTRETEPAATCQHERCSAASVGA